MPQRGAPEVLWPSLKFPNKVFPRRLALDAGFSTRYQVARNHPDPKRAAGRQDRKQRRLIQIGFSFEDSAAIHDIGPVHKFRQIQLALGLLSFLRSGSWPANPRGNTRLGSKG